MKVELRFTNRSLVNKRVLNADISGDPDKVSVLVQLIKDHVNEWKDWDEE